MTIPNFTHLPMYDSNNEIDELLFQCFDYPDYQRVNRVLNKVIVDSIGTFGGFVSGGTRKTDDYAILRSRHISEVNDWLTWIESLIPEVFKRFLTHTRSSSPDPTEGEFKIDMCWGLIFNPNDNLIKHSHYPHALAFAYYVDQPDGCSPLVIEGQPVEPKNGRLTIFKGHSYHEVPRSNDAGRVTISGNILYLPQHQKNK